MGKKHSKFKSFIVVSNKKSDHNFSKFQSFTKFDRDEMHFASLQTFALFALEIIISGIQRGDSLNLMI
jgi:hypothetical protein